VQKWGYEITIFFTYITKMVIITKTGGFTMPYGDGTGPAGMGPMTGRAAGYCAGYSTPGFQNRYPGGAWYGRGGGRGAGRGWRNWYYATGLPGWARSGMGYPASFGGPAGIPSAPELTPEREATILKNQAKLMEEEISSINDRIRELEQLGEKKVK
jgi:hypothetical protein